MSGTLFVPQDRHAAGHNLAVAHCAADCGNRLCAAVEFDNSAFQIRGAAGFDRCRGSCFNGSAGFALDSDTGSRRDGDSFTGLNGDALEEGNSSWNCFPLRLTIGEDAVIQTGKSLVANAGAMFQFVAAQTGTIQAARGLAIRSDGTLEIHGGDIAVTSSGNLALKSIGNLTMKGSKITQN